METKFTQFLRAGGNGEFLIRRRADAWVGVRTAFSIKSEFPNYAALRDNFAARLDAVIQSNTAMLLQALPGGHFRYTAEIDIFGRRQYVSVEYPEGYPDFRPFMTHPSGVRSVEIDVTGQTAADFRRANIAAGHPEWGSRAPQGWTWHHVEDARTMQLVPSIINGTFNHRGGASVARNP